MAIDIGKNTNGNVTYKNPPVDRVLFPNLSEGATPEEIEEAINKYFQEHPEIIIPDGSILPVKLDSTNSATDGYALKYNDTEGKFEWYNIEDTTVGNAEQLVSTQYVNDNAPYLYRTTGGSADVGNREYVDAIVGGSVVFNQLYNETGSSGVNAGVTYTKEEIGWAINGATTKGASTSSKRKQIAILDLLSNHVLYVRPCAEGTNLNSIELLLSVTDIIKNTLNVEHDWVVKTTYAVTGGVQLSFRVNVESVEVNASVKPQIFDLTRMFGETVADAFYVAEQASAGAGVKLLRALFTKPYYEYDAGTLKSVEGLTSHRMVGFNQWDEAWEVGTINYLTGKNESNNNHYRTKNFIPLVDGASYYVFNKNTNVLGLRLYDANKNYITAIRVDTTGFNLNYGSAYLPSGTRYIRFVNTSTNAYNHDICINLSLSGYRNGEYEPYKEHEYPLDSTLALRGIPKVDYSGNLYYDGDRYLPNGTVERRYGVVDLGTLNWVYDVASLGAFSTTGLASNVAGGNNIICAKYPLLPYPLTSGSIQNNNKFVRVNKSSAGNSESGNFTNGALIIKDTAFTDAAAFKTAMSGVLLVYKLANPVTETNNPYQEHQICNDWGTEEYVIGSQIEIPVPVGHETRYPANLRDKLQHLPNIASADGYYLIKQEGTQMTLDLFRIPKAPEKNGTYTLKATVSGGQPTYTWESV